LPAVRRLLVVPTGQKARVPVEVLAPEYLVSYVPSGTVFARLREQHRVLAGDALLALGDPLFEPAPRGSKYQALPGTRFEVEALRRLVGPARTTPLLGALASTGQLDRINRAGHLRSFRLVHLATHGEIDEGSPARSALILTPDRPEGAGSGRLTAGTILGQWRLDADLVVLSACQTALGRDAGGNGLVGFAHAFLAKGARAVVLSRWKVDDTATALLMVRFYENLLGKRAGRKPPGRAEALAEARQWLRDLPRKQAETLAARYAGGVLRGTEGEAKPLVKSEAAKLPAGERPFAHPYYWAAFVLIGDPD
jgi:CHAT domain-containing protein